MKHTAEDRIRLVCNSVFHKRFLFSDKVPMVASQDRLRGHNSLNKSGFNSPFARRIETNKKVII